MKKEAVRSHEENGVERVDHDGNTEVAKSEDIEISQKERMKWYDNGAPTEKEKKAHKKCIKTEYDDAGNPMWRNEEFRTAKPRPHQYSVERRMQEQRDPGSTLDLVSEATLEQAMAQAFTMVCPIVMAGSKLSNRQVIAIIDKTKVAIEDVFSLETIAFRSPDLVEKYASIPGVTEEDGVLEKESEPECSEVSVAPSGMKRRRKHKEKKMTQDELNEIGSSCGLCGE